MQKRVPLPRRAESRLEEILEQTGGDFRADWRRAESRLEES
jgi:hypothetical protein